MSTRQPSSFEKPNPSLQDLPDALFPEVMVPILPWKNTKLLSQLLGDTVYVESAFSTAIRLLNQMGVPREGGAIGVEIPGADPDALGEEVWESGGESGQNNSLRAVVRSRDVTENQENFSRLLPRLSQKGWFGLEIIAPEENFASSLASAAKQAREAGLHTTLALLPGALHAQNQSVITLFETVALDLLNHRHPPADRLRYLPVKQVVGMVVNAGTDERTDLESALQTLVWLQAGLDVDARVSVGVLGQFSSASLAVEMRQQQDLNAQVWRWGAKKKIASAIDLSIALRHGKESVAPAFAADQIARAARLTLKQV